MGPDSGTSHPHRTQCVVFGDTPGTCEGCGKGVELELLQRERIFWKEEQHEGHRTLVTSLLEQNLRTSVFVLILKNNRI